MKPVRLLFIVLFVSYQTYAAGVLFEYVASQTQWNAVLNRAKTSKKLLFVDFYTDWCGWCKKMDKEVFSLDKVANYYNSQFINLKINAENDELGKELAQKFRVDGFPTYIFIDSNAQVVTTLVGYQQAEPLLESGRSAISLWKLFPVLKSKIEKGKATPEEIRDYAVLIAKKNGTDAAKPYVSQYLPYYKPQNLHNPADFEFATFFLKDINSENFDYFAKNYQTIAQKVGVEKVDEYKYLIFEDNFMRAVAASDEAFFDKILEKLLPIYLDGASQAENDMLRFTMQSGFYERTAKWDKYIALVENFRDQKAEDRMSFIYQQCEKIALQFDQPEMLAQALKWMQAATNEEKSFDNYFLYTILWVRNGNKAQAAQTFELAQKLATTEEQNAKLMQLFEFIK